MNRYANAYLARETQSALRLSKYLEVLGQLATFLLTDAAADQFDLMLEGRRAPVYAGGGADSSEFASIYKSEIVHYASLGGGTRRRGPSWLGVRVRASRCITAWAI